MRAALRRRRGRSTQNYTHTYTHEGRQRRREQPGTCARLVAGSGKGDSGRMKKFGKRINIDRFWKVGKKNSNSFTVAGRQMGKENGERKNSGRA